jgi:3'-phosphoadenosine 5'-phosphosulfate sulfotransferase (PAPS reductase)/FAD synthetase
MSWPFGLRTVFPLLDWTHDDVWNYLTRHHVPVSTRMYEGRTKRPHTNPVCYRCHDPYGPSLVTCPLTEKPLMNLGHFTHDDGVAAVRAFGFPVAPAPLPV